MPDARGYYGTTSEDLRRAAKMLQLGDGIAVRTTGPEAQKAIDEATRWAEGSIAGRFAIPLKPTPLRGTGSMPVSEVDYEPDHFPVEFMDAIRYWAVGFLLESEFSQTSPQQSQSAQAAMARAAGYIGQLLSRRDVPIGAGRQVHRNPFMPPVVAPPEQASGPAPNRQ
jgi:hypothetical protein